MKPACPGLVISVLCMIMYTTQAQLATVTLFDIIAPTPSPIFDPNSVSFSFLGTNSEGGTMYLEDVTESLILEILPSTTQFVTASSPAHLEYTIVADASGIVWNKANTGSTDFGVAETCTWGSDGLGECIQALQFPGETTKTFTLTVSGSKFAFATLTESIPTSSVASTPSTTTQSASANDALTLRSCAKDIAGMVVVIATIVGGFIAF